jgi:hypothetical protein
MIENWATDFGLLVSLSNNLLLTVNCKLKQTFISAQLWIFKKRNSYAQKGEIKIAGGS